MLRTAYNCSDPYEMIRLPIFFNELKIAAIFEMDLLQRWLFLVAEKMLFYYISELSVNFIFSMIEFD